MAITITAHDEETGDEQTEVLRPDSYVLVVGERMELAHTQVSANGTTVLTIKRRLMVGE